MPSRYTCDGQNISPPLTVSEVPEDARSLVLIMDDPDIPDFVKEKYGIQIWDHWIVFNIASTIKEISEGQNPAGILGKNTRGSNAYSGPCPPDAEHRYFFKLLAFIVYSIHKIKYIFMDKFKVIAAFQARKNIFKII